MLFSDLCQKDTQFLTVSNISFSLEPQKANLYAVFMNQGNDFFFNCRGQMTEMATMLTLTRILNDLGRIMSN